MSNMFAGSSARLIIDHMGEEVIYKPAGGGTRSVRAVVEREVPGAIPELTRSVAPSLIVTLLDSNTEGISRSELNAGGDLLSVRVKAGGPFEDRAIGTVEIQDGGMLRLQVR